MNSPIICTILCARALCAFVCTPQIGRYIINPAFANPDNFVLFQRVSKGNRVFSLKAPEGGEPHHVLFLSFGEVFRSQMVTKANGQFQSINWTALDPLGPRTLDFMAKVRGSPITYRSYMSTFGATTIYVQQRMLFLQVG